MKFFIPYIIDNGIKIPIEIIETSIEPLEIIQDKDVNLLNMAVNIPWQITIKFKNNGYKWQLGSEIIYYTNEIHNNINVNDQWNYHNNLNITMDDDMKIQILSQGEAIKSLNFIVYKFMIITVFYGNENIIKGQLIKNVI